MKTTTGLIVCSIPNRKSARIFIDNKTIFVKYMLNLKVHLIDFPLLSKSWYHRQFKVG